MSGVQFHGRYGRVVPIRFDCAANFHAVAAGFKRVFHKLETYGDQCLQIPVFTGMTGFGAVLRVDGENDVANRRTVYGPTLERRLLKQALETRRYIRPPRPQWGSTWA